MSRQTSDNGSYKRSVSRGFIRKDTNTNVPAFFKNRFDTRSDKESPNLSMASVVRNTHSHTTYYSETFDKKEPYKSLTQIDDLSIMTTPRNVERQGTGGEEVPMFGSVKRKIGRKRDASDAYEYRSSQRNHTGI
eukprot:UN33556